MTTVKSLNLYLLTQHENHDYDTYDSCIVAAENEYEAKRICPDENYKFNEKSKSFTFSGADDQSECGSWAFSLEKITATLIGVAEEGTKHGVILASFNAG